MDHVRIAQHRVGPAADRASRVLRRIAVVRERAHVDAALLRELLRHLMELRQLILRERLRRKEIKRPCRRVAQDRAQDWRVVTERLARCGGRGDDDMTPGKRM